uniref:Uncharacterized protein n=1 Tax=Zea mays TaxID=4577 RepID=C4J2G5_MAIZE|nr:unknown [Zea mays]
MRTPSRCHFSTSSLISAEVVASSESSNTWTRKFDLGQSRLQTAPMDCWYTSLSLHMGICTSTMGTPSGPASTSSLSAGSGGTGLTPLSLIQKQPRQSTRRSTLWTRKRRTQALVRNCSGGAR